MNTHKYKVGDKVVIDDEQGTIESVDATHPSGAVRYKVQYGRSILSAFDVPEDDLEPWVEGI